MSATPPESAPQPAAAPTQPGAWERQVLENLVMEVVREKRRARRWSIFFRFVLLAIVGAVVFGGVFGKYVDNSAKGPHTALIEINGEIAIDSRASADSINSALQDAFDDPQTKGVILRINSPGGSPVQASQIYAEIDRLRAKYDKPVYAVCEEVCASGAYYVAAAANDIYVNPASLVGSIGVLMDGFGFSGLMDKLGISRRLLTAGANKGFMDPFSPMPEAQKTYALGMLEQIHKQFIAAVEQGRGKRLKVNDQTFSGLVWTGESAVQQGLADGYGTVDQIARDKIKAPDIVDYTPQENVAERLAKRFGAELGMGAVREFTRAGWSLR
ncbi:S49 family peptidase [Thiomonas sp.]|jgi:protease-4|uniref:S49 family peptidase n=1 Tax=Thiomonas sp. TaxID=2047785 RepID=UPI00262E4172|nr:S49 family peptidase [Thiomonas sp.]